MSDLQFGIPSELVGQTVDNIGPLLIKIFFKNDYKKIKIECIRIIQFIDLSGEKLLK